MILRYFTSGPHMRRALALWVILAVAVSIKIACFRSDASVYPVFVASAQHWWKDVQLYAQGTVEGLDGYRYSPSFAVAFTPFARLPYVPGAILWSAGSIAVLVWALLALMRDVLPPPSDEGWSPWKKRMFLTLTLCGSAVGIWSGQTNAVVTGLICLALAAVSRGRWWRAALLLAVPVFIKIWPLAIVLLLIAFWPRPLTWRFVAACLLLAAIPFLTRPPGTVAWHYCNWYYCLIGPLQARNSGYRDAWTFWEQLSPLFGCRADWSSKTSHLVYMAIELTTALGVFGWCAGQFRKERSLSGRNCEATPSSLPSGRLLTQIFSIWAAWQLLFGPATEQLTYGLIAPAAAWAVLVSFAEKRARWLTAAAWSLLTFMPSGDIERSIAHVFPARQILAPLGVALFVAWLVWHERGEASSPLPLGEG